MPCYTRITVEVKDEASAREALDKLGYHATIRQNANGTYTVTAQGNFDESTFRTEYAATVTTKQAKKAGYNVIRKQTGRNQVELVLRRYT